jgi:putative transposase
VFWRWRKSGVWQRIHDALRKRVRQAAGKKRTPTATILDSQSIRTAAGGDLRGYDAGKTISDRKRHLAVDTLGLVWMVWCMMRIGKITMEPAWRSRVFASNAAV